MSEETKTYSSHPFISHDGLDENGIRAEVRVVTGYGNIKDIEPSANGKASNVIFSVENTKYLLKGWAPEDSDVMKKVHKAQENNEPIYFRIETRRKDHVDRSLPMDTVAPKKDMNAARDNIFKSLAAVKLKDDEEWTISKHALTRLEEDPRQGGAHSAYDYSIDELRGSSKPVADNRSGSRHSIESTPFFTRNNDGEINPGSTAVAVPLNLYNFVAEWNRTHENVDFSEKQLIALTKAMLLTANRLQKDIYNGKLEEPDLALGSHTRARALVFDVTRNFFPITEETVADKKSLQNWADEVYNKALSMWKWSIEEINKIA